LNRGAPAPKAADLASASLAFPIQRLQMLSLAALGACAGVLPDVCVWAQGPYKSHYINSKVEATMRLTEAQIHQASLPSCLATISRTAMTKKKSAYLRLVFRSSCVAEPGPRMDTCIGSFRLPDIGRLPIRATFKGLVLSAMTLSLPVRYLFLHSVDTAIVDSNLCVV